MSGVKNIIAVSHKGGHVFPNAHHPAEAKDFYAGLEKSIPAGVKLIQVAGHDHNSAAAPLKGWYVAGNGGKSFYAAVTIKTGPTAITRPSHTYRQQSETTDRSQSTS